MKKQLMRVVTTTLSGRFFKTTAIVLMLAGATIATTQAAPVPAAIVTLDPGVKNAEIKHLSTSNQSLVFEVKVDNASGEKFSVIIKDVTGTTLYRGTYADKTFTKKFVLPKTDNERLSFTVKSSSGVKTESFVINSNTRVIEEVVVTKL